MADLRKSGIEDQSTKSRTGSFINSVLQPSDNKTIVHLSIPGLQLVDPSKYKKQQVCQVCFKGFGKLTGQHHCRVCANAVCKVCSYSSINKQRCCDICAYKYKNQDQQTNKQAIIFQLRGAAQMFVQSKNALEQELKKINEQANDMVAVNEKAIENSERKILELQKQIEQLKKNRALYEKQISQISVE